MKKLTAQNSFKFPIVDLKIHRTDWSTLQDDQDNHQCHSFQYTEHPNNWIIKKSL